LIDDVCMLLSVVHAGEGFGPLRNGIHTEATELLSRCFLDGSPDRIGFVSHLAASAGLVRVEGKAWRLRREQARLWLGKSRAEQLREFQETWLGDSSWNDLCHVPSLRCEETGWRNDPLVARKAVVDSLRRAAADVWMSISGFVDAVRAEAPDYARPDGDFESWYIRDARSGEYLTGFEHWDRVEGALLVYLLTGPLHWLGVVSLGYKEGWDKPSAFHLTPWGGAFLGLSDCSMQDLPCRPALVGPDGTITLAREFPLRDRFQLARIAEWRSSGAEYVYALTPAVLGRALSEGIEIERIERFLSRISQGHVPAASILRLRHWAQRYGHVRLRRAVILETRTPQTMAELRTMERVKGYLRQAVSPTMAVVREGDWDPLVQELYRAGYLPEIVER
jgi:hypothetical protein